MDESRKWELERDVEKKLLEGVRALGGKAIKWVAPGTAGVPDRIIIAPPGVVCFVEVKRNSGELSALQKKQIDYLRALGAKVYVLWGMSDVKRFLDVLSRVCYERKQANHGIQTVQLPDILY